MQDQLHQRSIIMGHVKIKTRPLVLIESKGDTRDGDLYIILLYNAKIVGFVSPCEGHSSQRIVIHVTSLKVGLKF